MRFESSVRLASLAGLVAALLPFGGALHSAVGTGPVVSIVPFSASSPATPHTSWSGNQVTLKGAFSSPNLGTNTFSWDWDPGDGGTHCTGTIPVAYSASGPTNDPNVIGCAHTYAGAVGTVFTAVLNVTDNGNGLMAAAVNCPPAITKGGCYYTSLNAPPPNLPIEVNNAIDNGLWYLHQYMNRTTSSFGSVIGNWTGGAASGSNVDTNGSGDSGPNALDCSALEVSGFLATVTPPNPYSNDVQLCLNGVFDIMITRAMGPVTLANAGSGASNLTFTPDFNSNGIGVEHNGGDANYETGMAMDSITAAGTPTALVPTNTRLGSGTVGKGSGTGGAYLYKDAIIDAVDDYSFCENIGDTGFGANLEFAAGGWHYTCQETNGDNSVSQWAAIGIIPARRNFGSDPLNPDVLAADQNWLTYSFNAASSNNGYFGYTSNSPLWGPYAVTPSGLVQLAMNGLGRGTTVPNTFGDVPAHEWDSAETYIRDNFGNPQGDGPAGSLKDYYYGMFSFTKAMLLHDNSGTGLGNTPLQFLQSDDDPLTCAPPGVPVTSPGSGSGPCYPAIDWYAAQSVTFGGTDPTDGVARTIIGNQIADGSWFGNNYVNNQNYFQTAVAIIMLNKTVFHAVPVACFSATPNPVANGGQVTLNGNCSHDENAPPTTIVSWEWDTTGDGGSNFNIQPGSMSCKNPSCSIAVFNASSMAPGLGGSCTSFPCSYPVTLKVTDNATPTPLTAQVTSVITISSPPTPPTANAGGPYNFCPNQVNGVFIYQPWYLNGSNSVNPDQGKTDGTPNAPPSTICNPATAGTTGNSPNACGYYWDLNGSNQFAGPQGPEPNVTGDFGPATYGTTFNVSLKVVNNDNLAFPTAGLMSGLSSVATAQVSVHNATDEPCTHCVSNLKSIPHPSTPGVAANIQLYWTDTNSAAFPIAYYNVYRSPNADFSNFIQIAGPNSVDGVPAVQVPAQMGSTVYFEDQYMLTNGGTYYYRVAPATANGTETCNSNLTLKVTLTAGR